MNPLHRWDLSPTEAVALQRELSRKVRLSPLAGEPETIAGADISFHRFSNIVDAGIVVLCLRDLSILATSHVRTTAPFPYVPGLLSFREAPPLLEAWERLQVKPDVLMLDGHGTAHPRRFGLACHLGLWLDLPTIGCAKQRLTGQAVPPPLVRGGTSPLEAASEVIGTVVRTRDRVAPVYVSPGHRIDLATAVRLVLASSLRHRQPEPTWQAHLLVNQLRRQLDQSAPDA
jgi:deoxyribonuclease V